MLIEPQVKTERDVARLDPAPGEPVSVPVFVARPRDAGARRPGLVLIQEIFGVNEHIQDMARRLACNGYVVAAPDLFHRTGPWQTYAYTDVARAMEAAATLTEERTVGDLRAALAYLAAQPDVDPTRLGMIGFCMGGRLTFAGAALLAPMVKAGAIYYGGGITESRPGWPVPLIDRAGDVRCPLIAFFGGLDKHIPREQVERIDAALAAAGVNRQVYFYPEADHGFMCDARASYHPRAAQDAWHRTLLFFSAHLGPVPPVSWEG